MSGSKRSDLIPCLTLGFDLHTWQVLFESGFIVTGFIGIPERCDFVIEEKDELKILLDGAVPVKKMAENQLQLWPVYPAFSCISVWKGSSPILWGSPVVHPTSFVSHSATLGQGVVIGPGCLIPEGVELENGVRLVGGNRLRRNQKVPEFRLVRWGDLA